MAPSFVVGGRYRNRHGAYQVLSIEGDRMTIRYDDGEVAEVTVEMQARIAANMQAERDARRAAPGVTVGSKGHRAPGQAGSLFRGLHEHDFQRGVAGTSWRRRSELGSTPGCPPGCRLPASSPVEQPRKRVWAQASFRPERFTPQLTAWRN